MSLRRRLVALAQGGLEWLVIEEDAVVFVRRYKDEAVYVAVARSPFALELRDINVSEFLYGNGTYSQGTLTFTSAGMMIWR
jgi:hypothetical protein